MSSMIMHLAKHACLLFEFITIERWRLARFPRKWYPSLQSAHFHASLSIAFHHLQAQVERRSLQ
jgi:hypothetical protein